MALIAVSLPSCAPLPSPDHRAELGVVEPVYAAALTGDVAMVRVSSNGCTRKEDLYPQVSRGAGLMVLTVRRIQPDTCNQPLPEGMEMRWSFDELGVARGTLLTVANPLKQRDHTLGGQR